MRTILPFAKRPGECLSLGPSQGIVFAIDPDIVIKMPFQYPIVSDIDVHHMLDLSVRSFVCLERELAVYDTLKARPHHNIAQRFETDNIDCLFLERLTPLDVAWPHSTETDRRRWALEFINAVSWLETCGWASGDLAVRNIGIDDTNRLKIFDFGSAINESHADYAYELARDHFDLATCLNFILSGLDPFATARSSNDIKRVRAELSLGLGKIGKGAEVLGGVIQRCWTGRDAAVSFGQIARQVFDAISPFASSIPPEYDQGRYKQLENRCRTWLANESRNTLWMDAEQYVLGCKSVGHDANLDAWR